MKAIILCHPQSVDALKIEDSDELIEPIRIACGTTVVPNADLSESNDFFPTYASWNTCLFETSVILTAWEHADQLVGDDSVAFLHTDVLGNEAHMPIWPKVRDLVADGKCVGLTAPSRFQGMWNEWLVPDDAMCVPRHDPFWRHPFDHKINVWDYIKKYDADIYDFAMDAQPKLIYSHQFACSRSVFDSLGDRLYRVASSLRLRDVGFWTPHMFERLIALYLASCGEVVLTTALWHLASSGISGPGDFSLYGPRPLRYYQIMTRAGRNSALVK